MRPLPPVQGRGLSCFLLTYTQAAKLSHPFRDALFCLPPYPNAKNHAKPCMAMFNYLHPMKNRVQKYTKEKFIMAAAPSKIARDKMNSQGVINQKINENLIFFCLYSFLSFIFCPCLYHFPLAVHPSGVGALLQPS